MSHEDPFKNVEKVAGQEPSEGEIFGFLDQMLGSGNYKEVSRKNDEQGLRDLRVESKTESGKCYEYSRRVDKEGVTRVTMDVTYYDENGIPYNGRQIANFIDSEWQSL